VSEPFPDWLRQQYCYLSTTGRRTGRPHEIEIWFALQDGVLYLLSGGGESSDWVRNLRAESNVSVRVGNQTAAGTARVVTEDAEDQRARRLLAERYQGWREGTPFSEWAATALPIAVEFG
jgi:deazaflavin-dependent oxidoreductase (nitroreductase family)